MKRCDFNLEGKCWGSPLGDVDCMGESKCIFFLLKEGLPLPPQKELTPETTRLRNLMWEVWEAVGRRNAEAYQEFLKEYERGIYPDGKPGEPTKTVKHEDN